MTWNSSLRRYTPLRAKTQLRTKTGLKTKTPLKSTAFKEEPFEGPLPEKNDYEIELDMLRPEIRKRSRGYCEIRIRGVCTGRSSVVHHRLRRPHGGPNSLANTLESCWNCHDWLHLHVRLSRDCGLLLQMGDDPEIKPVDKTAAMLLARKLRDGNDQS